MKEVSPLETINYLSEEINIDIYQDFFFNIKKNRKQELEEILNNFEIDVNVLYDGTTALIYSARLKHTDIVEILLKNQANPNIYDQNLNCPLKAAVLHSDFETVNLLLEYGADVNLRDKQGLTPLRMAYITKNIDMANLLLENGADVNIPSIRGYTILMSAAIKNDLTAIKHLLSHNADINHIAERGVTVYDFADSDEIKELLGINIENNALDQDI